MEKSSGLPKPMTCLRKKGLVGKFEKADDNEIFEIGDAISGFAYIPKRSILFISTGDVREERC